MKKSWKWASFTGITGLLAMGLLGDVGAVSTVPLVSLYASSPELRTGQSVTLMATTPAPLTNGETLSIINQATGQVLASTRSGQSLTAQTLLNAATSQMFTATITSTPVTISWVDHPVGNNQGYQNAAGDTVALSAPSGAAAGIPFTVKATPSGFQQPVYQFWWAMDGDAWQSSGPFSPNASFTIDPTQNGFLSVLVYAREATAPTHETSAERAEYEAKSLTSMVSVGPPAFQPSSGTVQGSGWVSLTTANQVGVGQTIQLQADGVDIPQPVYQFWFQSPGNDWVSSGPYNPANTFTITATMPGTWNVLVYARPGNIPANATLAERLASEVVSPVTAITVHP